jgi:hypothetical protein
MAERIIKLPDEKQASPASSVDAAGGQPTDPTPGSSSGTI